MKFKIKKINYKKMYKYDLKLDLMKDSEVELIKDFLKIEI